MSKVTQPIKGEGGHDKMLCHEVTIKTKEDLVEHVSTIIYEYDRYLLGRILTIIDATMPGQQGKAVKDLIHEIIRPGEHNWRTDMVQDGIDAFCEPKVGTNKK